MTTVRIPLHSRKYPGLFVTVDEEDYERVCEYRWHPSRGANTWYAATNIPLGHCKYRYVKMHRFLLDPPEGKDVDHKDGDGLKNTRSNLRICSRKQNGGNSGVRRHNVTGYRGVGLFREGVWRAQIRVAGKGQHIGLYPSPEEAAHAYDEAAWQEWGEYARLNFPTRRK